MKLTGHGTMSLSLSNGEQKEFAKVIGMDIEIINQVECFKKEVEGFVKKLIGLVQDIIIYDNAGRREPYDFTIIAKTGHTLAYIDIFNKKIIKCEYLCKIEELLQEKTCEIVREQVREEQKALEIIKEEKEEND
jgi:hypothetical protein